MLPALSVQFTITAGVPSAHTNNDVTWGDNSEGTGGSGNIDHTPIPAGGAGPAPADDGTGYANLNNGDHVMHLAVDSGDGASTELNLEDLDQESFTHILQNVAELRAVNGGQVRRLQYALANVETQITNITAANGRIMDVDVAAESSNLAKQQVLVQASAAMTAQANVANDVALMLLQ